MTQDKKWTVDEVYDFIMKQVTPEEAVRKFLAAGMRTYERLKFDKDENPIPPEFIIAMCAMDLGWGIGLEARESEEEEVRGLVIGTEEYLDSVLGNENKKA